MKKLLLVAIVVAAVVCFAGSAFAGDYHSGATLICSDCHIMHASQTHAYDPANQSWFRPYAAGANANLLRDKDVNALCLHCHDGGTHAPDVLEANTGSFEREAGALNEAGSNPYETWKGHTLGSTDVAPGGTFTATTGLECTSCHAQHGNTSGTDVAGNTMTSAWRNVKTMGGKSISYAAGTNNLTKDVFERDATLGQVATHYSVTNVDFNKPNPTDSGLATWCKGCHTDFHGNSTSANMNDGTAWVRHPVADAVVGGTGGGGFSNLDIWKQGYRTGSTAITKTAWVKVLSDNGKWGVDAGNPGPSCMSCHKAHGSQNAYGLVYMTNTGSVSENGDGTNIKDTCKQCHVQG